MSLYSYNYQHSQNLQTSSTNHDHHIRKILIRLAAVLFSLFIVLTSNLFIKILETDYVSPVSAFTPNEVRYSPVPDEVGFTPNEAESSSRGEVGFTPNEAESSSRGEVGQTQSSLQQSNNEAIEQLNNITISITPSPTPTSYHLTRNFYTIAIIGDSMVDTMGEVLEYLDSALKKKYPNTKFLLYNYGTGAQNIEMGLARFGSHFKYQSRDYQTIPELKPDILIVASFSYNPFTPHDRDRHWLTLTKLVQEAKLYTPQVYMLAEIAPLRKDFGKGPQGVNWSDDTNYEHSGRIIEQLQNAIGLSSTLNVPLIDAFTPSLDGSKIQGQAKYVNPSDGIHPSVEGHQFMAEKIAQALKLP